MQHVVKFSGILVMLFIFFSCSGRRELDITRVDLPSYYEECSYKVYIQGVGFDHSWSNNVSGIHFYKDSKSNTFFTIGYGTKAIMSLPKTERLRIFKLDAVESEQLLKHGLLNGIEYYKSESCDTLKRRTICGVTTHLLSFKDSTHVIVSFASSEGWKKRKDYDKIVLGLIQNN